MPNTNDPGGLGLTYKQLLLTASRELECEFEDDDGEPIVPPLDSARGELRRCETVVARAVRRLVGERPDWSWMRQVYSMDLVADTEAYDMPWYFGGMAYGPWIYTGEGPASTIAVKPMTVVDRARAGTTGLTSGEPVMCGFRVKDRSTVGDQQPTRWEVVFNPVPSQAQTIEIAVRAYPERMTDLGHRFIGGEEVNAALEAAVQVEALLELRKFELLSVRADNYKKLLDNVTAIENAGRARNVGRLVQTVGPVSRDNEPTRSNYTGPLTYNGTIVT